MDIGKIRDEAREEPFLLRQIVPLSLTIITLAALVGLLYLSVLGINSWHLSQAITLNPHWQDILAGAVIYLKTSVDFALFMGFLMTVNPGWKNRIAIEIGTAVGNAFGTILILIVWIVFKQLEVLLALMILLSALVLFELAAEGLGHFKDWKDKGKTKAALYNFLSLTLGKISTVIHPITSKILPDFSGMLNSDPKIWKKLLFFSLTVPFILGLDDFAGYVPLFSLVNVFGFALGTMLGHCVLNIALFLKPQMTINWVRNEWVSFFGTLAFFGLGVFGVIEALRVLIP